MSEDKKEITLVKKIDPSLANEVIARAQSGWGWEEIQSYLKRTAPIQKNFDYYISHLVRGPAGWYLSGLSVITGLDLNFYFGPEAVTSVRSQSLVLWSIWGMVFFLFYLNHRPSKYLSVDPKISLENFSELLNTEAKALLLEAMEEQKNKKTELALFKEDPEAFILKHFKKYSPEMLKKAKELATSDEKFYLLLNPKMMNTN